MINRLRLYYNREEVFEIRSDGEGKGTQVFLYLPLEDEVGYYGTGMEDRHV